jgi:hypothetical protein
LEKKIGLTEEQQQLLREKAAEKDKQLYKKYAELRSQMEKELLKEVLTPEQRDQLKKLIGEPFEFQFSAAQGSGARNIQGQPQSK